MSHRMYSCLLSFFNDGLADMLNFLGKRKLFIESYVSDTLFAWALWWLSSRLRQQKTKRGGKKFLVEFDYCWCFIYTSCSTFRFHSFMVLTQLSSSRDISLETCENGIHATDTGRLRSLFWHLFSPESNIPRIYIWCLQLSHVTLFVQG